MFLKANSKWIIVLSSKFNGYFADGKSTVTNYLYLHIKISNATIFAFSVWLYSSSITFLRYFI